MGGLRRYPRSGQFLSADPKMGWMNACVSGPTWQTGGKSEDYGKRFIHVYIHTEVFGVAVAALGPSSTKKTGTCDDNHVDIPQPTLPRLSKFTRFGISLYMFQICLNCSDSESRRRDPRSSEGGRESIALGQIMAMLNLYIIRPMLPPILLTARP